MISASVVCAVREGGGSKMIRHDIIVRVKPGVSREQIELALRDIRELLTGIPGVERIRYGANDAPAYRHAMIAIELADEIALHRFSRHPQSARALRLVNRLAESTAVGSYAVESERRG
jgi:Stress responsive A/B Barrel Domain